MSTLINSWRIQRNRNGRGGLYLQWIIKDGEIIGRAERHGREWTAYEKDSNELLWAEFGVEIVAPTLTDLVIALAAAEEQYYKDYPPFLDRHDDDQARQYHEDARRDALTSESQSITFRRLL